MPVLGEALVAGLVAPTLTRLVALGVGAGGDAGTAGSEGGVCMGGPLGAALLVQS